MKKVILGTGMIEQIMNITRDFVAKDNARPLLKNIKLDVYKNKIEATAIDGYKLAILELNYQNENQEEFSCYIKPFKLPKGIITTEISVDEKYTYITLNLNNNSAITYTNISDVGEFLNVKKILPELNEEFSISFNANYLAKMVNSVKDFNGNVKMYFSFEDGKLKKMTPMRIETDLKDTGHITSILLPVRIF